MTSLNYNGNLQTPPVVVKDGRKKLEENVDYKLSYRNNMAVGTAYVTITGIGDYKGAVTTTFEILYVKSPQTTPSQLSSVGIYLWQYENGMIEGGAVVNSEADTSQLLYRWLVYDVKTINGFRLQTGPQIMEFIIVHPAAEIIWFIVR